MLVKNKFNQSVIYVLANILGEIVYSNDENCIIIDSLNNIFDTDHLMKISMATDSVSLVRTKVQGYSYCIISITGDGIGKHYELMLIEDNVFACSEKLVRGMEKYIEILNSEKDNRSNNDMSNLINNIVDYIKSLNYDGKIISNIEKETIGYIDAEFFTALILNAITILHEFGNKKDIYIHSNTVKYGTRIVLSTSSENEKEIYGIYDFCREYPYVSSLCVLARVACNQKGIEMILQQKNGKIEFELIFPSSKEVEFGVYNKHNKEISVEIREAFSFIIDEGIENLLVNTQSYIYESQ
ncbi:MAG: hypothetical protein IJX51_01880 [Clostridia bacterium]|nr:hypothetical protein [Clostridia bacterium]